MCGKAAGVSVHILLGEERNRVKRGSCMITLVELSLCGGSILKGVLGWLLMMSTVPWGLIGQ